MTRRSILILACGASTVPAQERAPRRTALRIPVWAESPEPLDAKEFRGIINGKPAAIKRARGPGDDMVILLAVDLTENLTLIESARSALAAELETLPANAWIALLKTNDLLQVLVDPTPDRSAVSQAVSGISIAGKAGLLATLETATAIADSLVQKSGVRTAVFYLTDSNAYNYREDYTNPIINSSDYRDLSRRFSEGLIREKILKVEGNLSVRETPFFFVHLDYRSDPVNEAYQAGLMQIAASTGGGGIFCRSIGEIPEAVKRFLDITVRCWQLEVEIPPDSARNLQIQIENSGRSLTFRPRFTWKGR